MEGETCPARGETRETWVKGENVRNYRKNKEYRTTLSLLSTIPLYPHRALRTRAYTRIREGWVKKGKVRRLHRITPGGRRNDGVRPLCVQVLVTMTKVGMA